MMETHRRWWALPGDDRSEADLAQRCEQLLPEVEHAIRTALPEDIEAMAIVHREMYIGELILNESDTVVPNEEVQRILALTQPPASRLERKIYNLGHAIDYLFPRTTPALHSQPPQGLTTQLVRNVHNLVMDGLLDNAGVYRTSEAAPAGFSMYYYKAPTLIPRELDTLCRRTAVRLASVQRGGTPTADDILTLASIGGDFLGTFLDIHPFSNGNGCTGRLLMSYILNSACIVPVSLCVRGKKRSRDIYLDILVQARLGWPHDYRTLHSLVVEAVHNNIAGLHWWRVPSSPGNDTPA